MVSVEPPNYSPGETTGIAARLDHLTEPARSYALNNLPLHLDRAGDAHSAQRLIRLARDGFPLLKAERTLDAPQSNLDYRYYFRATLRAHDLPGALQLARTRAGLSHLTDWLASGVLAGLLPYLGPDSKLWSQIQHAIASLEPVTLHVERLTHFQQTRLHPSMHAWMRRQFDRDAALARASARTDFLTAVATYERGAIDYVLDRANAAPVNEAFARALLTHLHELCDGARTTPDQALTQIAALLQSHREAFVASVAVLAGMSERSAAIQGLSAFEAILPAPGQSPEALLCATAVAHGWAAQGEPGRAEAVVRKCLELVPPLPADTALRMLYTSSYIEAAGRLLLAAAPFATLWTAAVPLASELAGRGAGRSHRSDALARFVSVVPWIADPVLRIEWLRQTLEHVREFVASDLDSEPTDPLDLSLTLKAALDGIPLRQQLSEPIEAALLDVLAPDIDRVLSSDEELQPFIDIISTAANMRACFDDSAEAMTVLLKRILAAAARSANVKIRIVAAEAFFQITSRDPTYEAAVVLADSLEAMVTGVKERDAVMLASGLLDSADRAWCVDRPEMCSTLAQAALAAAVRGRHEILFEAVTWRMSEWIEKADPGEAPALVVGWAAALVAFGQREEGTRMLADVDAPDRETRLHVANVLLDGGAPETAADMLASDLPNAVDFTDTTTVETSLEIARLLIRANGNQRAREILLAAAVEYRGRMGEVDDFIEAALLNAVRSLEDEQIIAGFLTRAELELVRSVEGDANMAARWYVTLALSASGNVAAAKNAWGDIAKWKEQRRAIAVHDRALAFLADRTSREACEKLLDAVRSVGGGENAEEALVRACRLLVHVDPGVHPLLLDGILKGVLALTDDRPGAPNVLVALCDALAKGPDAAMAGQALQSVMELVSAMPLPKRGGDAAALVGAVLRLISSHRLDANGRWPTLFARLCHPSAGTSEERLFREALGVGADLRIALEACEKVAEARERWPFVYAVLDQAIERGEEALRDDALARLIALFDALHEPCPGDTVRLSALFAACRTAAPGGITTVIETRLRSLGAPAPARAIVPWASHLAGTPLEPLSRDALAALRKDLNRFAEGSDDLRSLSHFLRLVPVDADDAAALFEMVAEWATSMPLVTNEDWRHVAFIEILQATGALDLRVRSAVQRRSLELASSALTKEHYGRKYVAQALVTFSFDVDTARWALSRWLAGSEGADGVTMESVVDLLVTSLEYKATDATPAVIDAFLEQITDFFPSALNREAAAHAACETLSDGLRDRLGKLLLHDYDVKGLETLDLWDLAFLATMPLAWWVERSPLIGVRSVNLNMLCEWIERVVLHSPESSWWSVVLATEWLSRSDPHAVPNLWFNLCTSPSWLPDDTRQAVLDIMTSVAADAGRKPNDEGGASSHA